MKTSIIKGTMFLSLATVTFMLSGYIINVFLGRYLGPVEYGIYGVLVSLISLVNVVQTSGISQAVSKFAAEEKYNINAIIKTGLLAQTVLSLFFFITFFLFADLIALLLNDSSLSPYIRLIAFIFPLYGIHGIYMDFYNGQKVFKKQALMNIIYSLSKLLLVIILTMLFKLNGTFIAFILAPIVSSLYGYYIPSLKVRRFPIKEIIKYSLPLIGVAIFANLMQSIDLFLIKSLTNVPEYPGYYTASQNIAKLIFFGMTAIFLILFPSISYAVSNKLYDKARNIISQTLRLMIMLILPLTFILSATSKELIELIYSNTYSPAESALSILVFAMGAFTIFTAMTYILSGSGKPHISSVLSFISLCVSVILCFILIPQFDLVGAAIATTAASFVGLILASFYIYKYFNKLISFISLIKITLASLVVYSVALNINIQPLLIPVVYVLLLGLYGILIFIFKELDKNDLQLFKSFIPGQKSKGSAL